MNSGGEVNDSYARGNILGLGRVVGLIGLNSGGVNSSYATGDVSGTTRHVGGLIGYNRGFGMYSNGGEVRSSYAEGEVSGMNEVNGVGGLIGFNSGEIFTSYSDSRGKVSGKVEIGGLVGLNDGLVVASYSHSNVEGDNKIGGIAGTNRDHAQVIDAYSTGLVNVSNDVGGLVGVNRETISSGYWDVQSSGKETGVGRGDRDGAVGLTTDEMTGPEAEENLEGFDFEQTWVTTQEYPILYWQ